MYFFIGYVGNIEQMFEDIVYIVIIEEDLGEALGQRCEADQCVFPHDRLLVLNKVIQMCEAVGEAL